MTDCTQSQCHAGVAHRRDVLERVAAEAPAPVTAQIIRARLTAFKEQMSHQNYTEGVCACCARSKRQSKLTRVDLPACDAAEPPDWLGWTTEQWVRNRAAWWSQVDTELNIDKYLDVHFHAAERLEQAVADRDLARESAVEHPKDEDAQHKLKMCILWSARVAAWREHLHADLVADSIPAPGHATSRWLLFKGGIHLDTEGSTVTCDLCNSCRTALSHKSYQDDSAVKMPPYARARGLWNGPEPVELKVLTYTERRVLRLARVYQTVKRISSHLVPWAKTSLTALPQYTTRNVVAYAQDPDAVTRVLCLTPEQLAKDIYVQFEGTKDPENFTE